MRKSVAILLAVFATIYAHVVAADDRPFIVLDVDSGRVIAGDMTTTPWFPASLTKLMTAEIAFRAVTTGLLSMDSAVRLSSAAASMPPSRSGIPVGSTVKLSEALEIMLTHSTNDLAVAIAETIAGSEDGFVRIMNMEASRLGMKGTHYANASGLPASDQVTTVEDTAILAKAIIDGYPQFGFLFSVPKVNVAGRTYKNTNGLVGRYPGLLGMKTGYICASGFNLAAAAHRDGHTYLAVVFGHPSSKSREARAAMLLDKAFSEQFQGQGVPLTSRSSGPGIATNLSRYSCGRSWNGKLTDDIKPSATPQTATRGQEWPYQGDIEEFGD